MDIDLPHLFEPRDYQLNLLDALDSGFKRAIIVWPRRHGKDKVCFNWAIKKLHPVDGKPSTCYYCLPEFAHGRRVIWDNIDNAGMRLLSHCPDVLVANKLKDEMKIEFKNGSVFQIVGSDNYDKLIGANPKLIIFSEYGVTNPRAWDFLRPIVSQKENGGTVIFNGTPRGRNHFYNLYKMAQQYPDDWFCELLTNEDTHLLSKEDLDRERREGMSEEMILQEYYCSWDIGTEGSYYGRCMHTAEHDGRIGYCPHDPTHLVYTAWDLGIGDAMAIVFFQLRGSEILIIDHYENKGYALAHYLGEIRSRTSYQYGGHFVPHDGRNRSIITGGSFIDAASQLGVELQPIPSDLSIDEGIEIVRGLFPRFIIDKTKCDYLIKCLLNYKSHYDEKHQVQRKVPLHDWSSHSSDAIRYACLAIKKGMVGSSKDSGEWSKLKSQYSRAGADGPIAYEDNNRPMIPGSQYQTVAI